MSGSCRRLLGIACAGLVSVAASGCAAYISPLQPPPYRDQVAAPYDVTWAALIRALAYDQVPLRAVARDSGVISSDDIVSPIGVYADCGTTELQINSKMRTFRLGKTGSLKSDPNYECVSTTRWEPNFLDTVRRYV